MPGIGKALAVDTPIPTPDGWTTMGDLDVGDQVFDELGRPCTVTATYNQPDGRECFEVVFDDGSVIVADKDHLWETHTRASTRYR
jgi:replicative DNA helicase